MKATIAILTVLVLGNLFFSGYLFSKKEGKTGYVYVEKLYDGYKGKSDIEKDLKAIENKQHNILDTLKLEITALEAQVANGNKQAANMAEMKKGNYTRLVQEFSEYNTVESQKHVQELLKQINEYVKDYGEEKGYSYVFGATGNGSLMYAAKGDDLTEEVAQYINKKYEGK